jgi:hypothetical protein
VETGGVVERDEGVGFAGEDECQNGVCAHI